MVSTDNGIIVKMCNAPNNFKCSFILLCNSNYFLESAQMYMRIFETIDRLPQLYKYYHKCQKVCIVLVLHPVITITLSRMCCGGSYTLQLVHVTHVIFVQINITLCVHTFVTGLSHYLL